MKKGGFTLIELLVVVSLIGILTGVIIAILNPNKFKGQARDGVRLNDMAVIKGALEQYYAENNSYPASNSIPFGSPWGTYLKSTPTDPLAPSRVYCYRQDGNNQNYYLCATVEDTRNEKNGRAGCGNYCVTNPF